MGQIITLSQSGQFTLPRAIREDLGFKKGDKAEIEVAEGKVVITRRRTFDEIEAEMQKMREAVPAKKREAWKKYAGMSVSEIREAWDKTPEGQAKYMEEMA
ncbi:AbrB/MazE/SpoVT family DNA-binding domain-containing protein [Candidatus Saccharibacteria bacterium]|nr:AbrB/MazE/SpoVT family DNA-binding domain-containing protein [Candidatus Saccharibacteria bacterium]